MNDNLIISLLVFSIIWITIILMILKKEKMPIKYSLVWLAAASILILVAVAPGFLEIIANVLGFETVSNMISGIMFVLLLYITMILTIIVSKQKKKTTLMIQEISMLKQRVIQLEGEQRND